MADSIDVGIEETSPLVHEQGKTLPTEKPVQTGKTTGEKFYNGLQFAIGQVTILIFTAAIAYIAKPLQNKMENWLMTNKTFPLAEKSDRWKRIGTAIVNATILWPGGTFFAPAMQWMENNREQIATWANKKWGKPGEVEAGHEHLKDSPKQSWGDVIKGRLYAWLVVFSSFTAFDTLIGKNKTGYRLDQFEDKVGKMVSGITKAGKEISHLPEAQRQAAYGENNAYRFGKILALDFFATAASIIIWNFISRASAKKRQEKERVAESGPAALVMENAMPAMVTSEKEPEQKGVNFAKRQREPLKDYRALAAAPKPAMAGAAL